MKKPVIIVLVISFLIFMTVSFVKYNPSDNLTESESNPDNIQSKVQQGTTSNNMELLDGDVAIYTDSTGATREVIVKSGERYSDTEHTN